MDLTAVWTLSLRVQIADGTVIGPGIEGTTTVIPIVGGEVQGPGWKGRVLAGGADWNTVHPGGLIGFCARYQFLTDDGLLVSVLNEGITPQNFGASLIKTRTTFQVDLGSRLAPLASGIHVGTLDLDEIGRGLVKVGVYRLP